jgi:hypothetical protein
MASTNKTSRQVFSLLDRMKKIVRHRSLYNQTRVDECFLRVEQDTTSTTNLQSMVTYLKNGTETIKDGTQSNPKKPYTEREK